MALTEAFINIEDILSFLMLLFNFKLFIFCNIILDRCKFVFPCILGVIPIFTKL